MKYLILLIFIPPMLLGAMGVRFTSKKLERMEMIRGWRPGATTTVELVRQKHRGPGPNEACWVTWTDEDIKRPGPNRLNLPEDDWNRIEMGDPIEIVRLPGDPSPHTKDGIYANDGNFAFDRALLIVEWIMIIGSGIGLLISSVVLHQFVGRKRRNKERRVGQK